MKSFLTQNNLIGVTLNNTVASFSIKAKPSRLNVPNSTLL